MGAAATVAILNTLDLREESFLSHNVNYVNFEIDLLPFATWSPFVINGQ